MSCFKFTFTKIKIKPSNIRALTLYSLQYSVKKQNKTKLFGTEKRPSTPATPSSRECSLKIDHKLNCYCESI